MHLLDYIKTKNIKNITSAAELALESAESHFQQLELPENQYDRKIEDLAKFVVDMDVSALSSFLNLDRFGSLLGKPDGQRRRHAAAAALKGKIAFCTERIEYRKSRDFQYV